VEIIDLEVGKIEQIIPDMNLCLGFFDSLHLGHIFLIKKALEKTGQTAVMTFDVPPASVITGKTQNCSVSSIYDKSLILEKIGVSYLLVLHFNEDIMKLSKDDFINLVLKKLNPIELFVGDDYTFGKGASGDANYLSKFFKTNIVETLKIDDKKIATSSIIQYIENGQMDKVYQELGRYYQITGLVVEGFHNGRKIGFPTANLHLDYPYILPKIGVYLGRTEILGQVHYGIVSVSTHPTIMELKEAIIEINIDSYEGNLYGKELSIDFLECVADIEKFSSLEELQTRLKKYKKYLLDNKTKYDCN